jgi:O-antigen/teichoic acid export membrane protein
MAEVPTASAEAATDSGAQSNTPIDARRLAGNYLLLLAGELLAKLANFFAFTFLGRILGAAQYGNLEFTLAVMVFFTLPVDLGLGVFGAREVAKDRRSASLLLINITLLRALLALVSLAVLLLFVWGIRVPAEVKQLLLLYGCSLLGVPLLLQWFFQGHDRMLWVAFASLVRYGIFATLVFSFVRRDTPLVAIGLVECAAVAAVAIFCVVMAASRFDLRLPKQGLRLRDTLGYLREAVPIGLTELTWAFLWYIATVLLGLMIADDSLGWFGASHRALMALHTFVWLYFFNLLPSIARGVHGPRTDLQQLLARSLRFTVWTGVLAALTVAMLSGVLLRVAYGPAFAPGGSLFATLIWMIPIALASGHYRYTLIAYNRQILLFRATAAAAALVVVGCLILIPRFGAHGAAWALLAGCTFEFGLVWAYVRRQIVVVDFAPHLTKPAVTAVCCFSLYLGVAVWNPVWAAMAAAGLYLVVMGVWEGREIRQAAAVLLPARPGRARQ